MKYSFNKEEVLTINCDSGNSINCFPMLKYSDSTDKKSFVKINNTDEEKIWPEHIVFPLKKTTSTNETNVIFATTHYSVIDKLNQFKPQYLNGSVTSSSFIQMHLDLYTKDPSLKQELKFDLIAFL